MSVARKFKTFFYLLLIPIMLSAIISMVWQNQSYSSGLQMIYAVDSKQESDTGKFIVYLFWGEGCTHCEQEKLFLENMKLRHKDMQVKEYEVFNNKDNKKLLLQMLDAYNSKFVGAPVTFVSKDVISGFTRQTKKEIEDSIDYWAIRNYIDPMGKLKKEEEKQSASEKRDKYKDVPLLGRVDVSKVSLTLTTIIIAAVDSLNPCSFFVLFSLLGLLVHVQSKKKMLLVGSIFVFFSGLIYLLLLIAWLNTFLVLADKKVITLIAGVVAILIAVINIKDYFFFKKVVSLTIPDSAKPKLYDRMKHLIKSSSVLSLIIGTIVLAISANFYELLCTAGFPMTFTRILTLNNLSYLVYYSYIVLYCIVYIIPLATIVILLTATLGKKKITQKHGRILKLVSGTMMLGLALMLLINPEILNNIFVFILILLGAVAGFIITIWLTKNKFLKK